MLKKIGIYSIVLMLGLLLGYLFFSTSEEPIISKKETISDMKQGKWTCAMHPKVKREEKGSCPLCSMDLVYMDTSDLVLKESQFEMTNEAIALAGVQTTTIVTESHKNQTVRLSGKIVSNQKTDAVQTSLFNGRVEKLFANFVGKKVYKGQKIGLIYAPDLYLAQDKLLGSISYKETHKSLFDAARNTAGLWKMTDAQIDTMLAQGKPIVNFPIYADVTGTVTEVLAKEGEFYNQGQPLFRTSDLRNVWVVFDVYEDQLPAIKEGQEIEVFVTNLNRKPIRSKVSFVEPVIDELTRTVAVRATLDNKVGTLKPGMFAEASLTRKIDADSTIVIPRSAVLWTGKRSLVYKKPIADRNIFEMSEIELGQRFGEFYEVIKGLKVGEVIVTEGAFTIDAAAELNGKKSMISN